MSLLLHRIQKRFASSGGQQVKQLLNNEIHKISRISVYQMDLPLKEGSYNWCLGKSVSVFDSTVVKLETDTGYTGYGEVTPLGPFYLPSYALGVRSGLAQICPLLLGENCLNTSYLNLYMDQMLKGHPYVKSPIDIACWDILGKVSGLPLVSLLGGRHGPNVKLYRAISQLPPSEMTANVAKYKREGYTKFQLKMGSTVAEDIRRIRLANEILDIGVHDGESGGGGDILVADANTGWSTHEALQIIKNTEDINVYIEEPCASYAENRFIRQKCKNPFIMDECIDTLDTLLRCISDDRAADIVNLKISKFGGLTKLKEARDLCVRMNIGMCIEDTWGSDIITAAIAAMAHSTPEKFIFSSTDFNSYNTVSNAHNGPQRIDGTFRASDAPGLGIEFVKDQIPVAVYE